MRRLYALGLVLAPVILALSFTTTSSATVLCKTAPSPCSGIYGKGTAVEASLKGTSVLHPPFGNVECSAGSIKGEVTSPGSEEANVSGVVKTLSLATCNATVTVLKSGTFKVESPKEGNGTLKLEGFETTVEVFGFHCIFSGSASFSLKGGEMASLLGTSLIKRTGGRSGVFCGSEASWTAEYTVTSPAPLYVAGRAASEWTMGGKSLESEVQVEYEGQLALGSTSGDVVCPVGFVLGVGPAGETVVVQTFLNIGGCAAPTGTWAGCWLIDASGTAKPAVDLNGNHLDITEVEFKYTFNEACKLLESRRTFDAKFAKITAAFAGPPGNSLTLSGSGESELGSVSILEEFEGSPSNVITEVGEAGTLSLME
ncbi:MAG TPA: hypothetical protein VFX44_04725 [Solirubrobacterales bacterium]|nr:hypothetical protein [Solirubrobacterales bacterium]